MAESFFSHLKTEMYHHHDFSNHMAARTAVMEYIESWYNRRRPHTYNLGLPPTRALAAYQNQIEQAAAQEENQSSCLKNLTSAGLLHHPPPRNKLEKPPRPLRDTTHPAKSPITNTSKDNKPATPKNPTRVHSIHLSAEPSFTALAASCITAAGAENTADPVSVLTAVYTIATTQVEQMFTTLNRPHDGQGFERLFSTDQYLRDYLTSDGGKIAVTVTLNSSPQNNSKPSSPPASTKDTTTPPPPSTNHHL